MRGAACGCVTGGGMASHLRRLYGRPERAFPKSRMPACAPFGLAHAYFPDIAVHFINIARTAVLVNGVPSTVRGWFCADTRMTYSQIASWDIRAVARRRRFVVLFILLAFGPATRYRLPYTFASCRCWLDLPSRFWDQFWH